MDFGIAKSKTDRKLTMTGTTMGSLYYMPPEQVQGTGLDARSDLYSLGVSLYEMVTGSRPFKGQSDYDLMVAQLQKAPLPPIDIQPELPKALNDIIMISLEKDPAKRFQSAEAFRFALQSVKGGLTSLPVASAQAAMPGPSGQTATASAAFSATGVLGAHPGLPTGAQLQPTVSSQSAIPPAQPPVSPPPATPRSYRGLYMTLGALVAILVIVLAATQLPHLLKTKAGGAGQAAQQTTPTATGSSSPLTQTTNAGANQEQPPSPISEPVPPSQTTAAQGGTAVGQQSEPSESVQGSSKPVTQTPAPGGSKKRVARGPQDQATVPNGHIDLAGGPAAQAPGEAVAPASQATQAAQAAAGDAAAKELDELGDRMTSLIARANAMKDSVENLRQRQVSAGYSLRPDISASLSRMEQNMGKADAALNARSPEAAKKYMDLAEQEVEKLEKFFGR
jgi:serine/threonine-protein kinase